MNMIRGTALAAVLTVLSGCLPKVEQPEVWLGGAHLSSLGLSGGVVNVRLGVYNPNNFTLQASGLRYDLDFRSPGGDDWADFTDGVLNRDLRVPAGDTLEVTVPVDFSYGDLSNITRGLLERGSFEYRVRGTVALEGPVERDITFRHNGTVTPSGVK